MNPEHPQEEQNADESLREENKKLHQDFINLLSDECLVKIFMYLSVAERLKIEQVCRRWKAVGPLAWYDVKEFNCNTLNEELDKSRFMTQFNVILVLQHCGFHLTNLVISPICDSSIMPYVTEYCPNLTSIELQLKNIDKSDFVEAFSYMTELKSIKITEYRFGSGYIAGDEPGILESLPERMREIHILSSGLTVPLDILFISTLEKFTSLCSLTLHGFTLDPATTQQLIQLTTLINLDLTGCSIQQPFSMSSLVNLEHLNLEQVKGIEEIFTTSIANGCENLKYLNMMNCLNIPDTAFVGIAKLRNLEHLILNNISNVKDTLFNHFFKLKVLECFRCCEVTDVGIMIILKNCSALEQLNVSGTSITVETLVYAVKTTKLRRNNIVLKITTNSSNVKAFNEMERDESTFLQILPCHDDDDDDDDDNDGYGEPDDVAVDRWWDNPNDYDNQQDNFDDDDGGFELF